MNRDLRDHTEKTALSFADAVLRIWGSNLDLSAVVMAGYRELIAIDYPGTDLSKSSANFQMRLDDACRGVETPQTERTKHNLVRVLLRVWFDVQQHLRNQIFVAVRELAVKRGEDPDMALMSVNTLLNDARHVEEVFAEKRDAVLSEKKRRDRAHAKRALEHMRNGLEKERLRNL